MAEPFTQRTPRSSSAAISRASTARAKASGQAEYLDDVAAGLKGVLYAKVLRSPYPHARIKRMDTSRGRGAPWRALRPALRRPRSGGLPADLLRLDERQHRLYDQMYYPQHQGRPGPGLHRPLGGRRGRGGGGRRERGDRRSGPGR